MQKCSSDYIPMFPVIMFARCWRLQIHANSLSYSAPVNTERSWTIRAAQKKENKTSSDHISFLFFFSMDILRVGIQLECGEEGSFVIAEIKGRGELRV